MFLYDLYKGRDSSIVPTLERIEKAVEHIGLKELPYRSVQIGGTNGKGSTCAFLESLLREHGYRTGWFVSPHLVEERERWRVNGDKISQERLGFYVEDFRKVFERFELTYFEACTLIALQYFKDEGVDLAVFEVGMGGKWDATKTCNPFLCVITNVERDHTQWLGKDVEKRAVEKLGIYKKGRLLILGSMKFPLYTKALELCREEDLIVAGLDFAAYGSVERSLTVIERYEYKDIILKKAPLGLWGKWQIENASLALTAASELIKLDLDRASDALSKARWEGRMEVLREKPLLMIDGAHNLDGIKRVTREVKKHIGSITPVFTGLREKEWKDSMSFLKGLFNRIYLVQIKHHRGENIQELIRHAKGLGFNEVMPLCSSEDVLCIDDDLLVIGSLYLVGEIKEAFERVTKRV
ncbi:MAG: bifunctional folylpolyglutamate synthase/dihydrofolate synthase [Aquificaceae bacterium]